MTDRRLVLLGRSIAIATTVCGFLVVIVLVTADGATPSISSSLQRVAGTLIVPAVVLITLPRVPRNGSVWAFAVVGLSIGVSALGDAIAWAVSGIDSEAVNTLTIAVAPADLPLPAAVGLTVALSVWIPSFVLIPTLVLLLFPDGRFPDPQRWWRWVGRITVGVAIVGMLGVAWQYPPRSTVSYDQLSQSQSPAIVIPELVFSILAVVSIVGYGVKWKRARGDERLQYRWVGFAFFSFAIWTVVSTAITPLTDGPLEVLVSWIMIIFLPVSYAVSILKYRLYGIDVVISRTVTYGVLAVFVTGVYALVVVGVGSLVDRGDEPNLALSITAVAIVAVAFEPLRKRVQHWANVLVYGKRATPYEVLASATTRFTDTRDPDHALTQVTQLVVDGTGASEAVLWLAVGTNLHPRAATPQESLEHLDPRPLGDDALSDVPGDRSVAIRHRGDVLGVLSITKPRGDTVSQAEDKVLTDVAAGTGVLLRNIGLNAELSERADQLQASRRRLVAAQDAERHRLERDLHDGAQQQVVALKVKLGIARTLSEREGADTVTAMLETLASTVQDAVDGMRAIAHGIYPPLLEAEGLEAAFIAARRTVPIPVEIVVDRVERYEQSVEESVYFAVLGTIAHAVDIGATRAVVLLRGDEELVRFSVQVDAMVDALTAVEDRIDAFGGTVTVAEERSTWVVSAELPARRTSVVRT